MSNGFSLLAIVGMAGSGKSIASDFFRSKGIPVLRFGDQTDIGLQELQLPMNEKNERFYRRIRKELGMAAMAIKIEPRILEAAQHNSAIVLDGLYSWEEYLYLLGRFPQLKLLCVYAPPEIRYGRLAVRKVRPLTKEEARTRDIAEIENLHKGGPIAMADYVLDNSGSTVAFSRHLDALYGAFV